MDSSLNTFATDTLKEVMNIGAGNAANALSQMTGMTVDISAPRLELLRVEDVTEFTGKPDSVMTVVLIQVLGDAPGVMMLMFPKDSALKIAHSMLRKTHTMLTDIGRTALREVGNVLAGSCLSSLSNFLKMNFIQSVPNAATDMVGALLSNTLADMGQANEQVLAAEVRFTIKEMEVGGHIFFMFDPPSTTKILDATQRYLPS